MGFAAQDAAIRPAPEGQRKIVLATTIAETSLTIDGIGAVIDTGFKRVPRFDPASGMTALETVRVSLASADQRRGRAGRLGPGVCYRLWPEAETRALVPHDVPEIFVADLAPLVLELAAWGVSDPPSASPGSIRRRLPPSPRPGPAEAPRGDRRRRPHHRHGQGHGEAAAPPASRPHGRRWAEHAGCRRSAAMLSERDGLPRDAGADIAGGWHAFRARRATASASRPARSARSPASMTTVSDLSDGVLVALPFRTASPSAAAATAATACPAAAARSCRNTMR